MSRDYVPPKHEWSAFNCPFCGAYAHQKWGAVSHFAFHGGQPLKGVVASICQHCDKEAIWLNKNLLHPAGGIAPLAHPDLPDKIKDDYNEARAIVARSPRGAAALLRLAIQKLCVHLGEKGKDLNIDIGKLVKKGLSELVQKALDSVRVIGNNAVHPGVIDLKDDQKTAQKLFGLVNFITDIMISKPKEIGAIYDGLPEGSLDGIARRDGVAVHLGNTGGGALGGSTVARTTKSSKKH